MKWIPGNQVPSRLGLFSLILMSGAFTSLQAGSLYIDYSLEPKREHLLTHDLCILHPDNQADWKSGQKLGRRYLAYLSLVEVAAGSKEAIQAQTAGVDGRSVNAEWDSIRLDVTNPQWQRLVVEVLAQAAMDQGYDGLFLDTADSAETLIAETESPQEAAAIDRAVVNLVTGLRARFPDAEIVLNRGFRWWDEVAPSLDGVMIESIYRTFSGGAPLSYAAVNPETSTALEAQVRRAAAFGMEIYGVDYVDPSDAETAVVTERRLRALGVTPFLTTPDLQGQISGFQNQVPRRILVLYGHDPEEAEDYQVWPEDTTSLLLLQPALEWMGYEVEYHDVSEGLPTRGSGAEFAGLILDETASIPVAFEPDYAGWIIARLDEGKKLITLGDYGFQSPGPKEQVRARLGLQGLSEALPPGATLRLVVRDEEILNGECPVEPDPAGFENLQAPSSASVALSLEASSAGGGPAGRYDPVFVANWGGAIFYPYLLREVSEETRLAYVDPFAFLARIFPSETFPAPDVTTRDGLRIFYTHIDGDGFTSLSWVENGKTCGEVLAETILENSPYPVTVSVIEADVRAHILTLKSEDRERYEATARKIFAMPHVEPASHSYSHPYIWDPNDESNAELYDTRNLRLKLTAGYAEIDLKREIQGSLDYIRSTLTPDKPPRIMLWSGNCRPSLEALRIAREAGVENMNGGNTILSGRFPGITGVAPKLVSQHGLLQIYASNQNEFYYTDGWTSPYNHGFSKVVQTFEKTDPGRRLKPVNVYYHFYSAETPGSLDALRKIFAWCQERPMHALTAWEYARLVRDSHSTRIVAMGDRRWVLLNEGLATTFRIPLTAGIPDLEASSGITGYAEVRDWRYVHTDGSGIAELVLGDEVTARHYLQSSTAPLDFQSNGKPGLSFQPRRDAEVVLAGPRRKAPGALLINGRSAPWRPNQNGEVRLTLPAGTPVELID